MGIGRILGAAAISAALALTPNVGLSRSEDFRTTQSEEKATHSDLEKSLHSIFLSGDVEKYVSSGGDTHELLQYVVTRGYNRPFGKNFIKEGEVMEFKEIRDKMPLTYILSRSSLITDKREQLMDLSTIYAHMEYGGDVQSAKSFLHLLDKKGNLIFKDYDFLRFAVHLKGTAKEAKAYLNLTDPRTKMPFFNAEKIGDLKRAGYQPTDIQDLLNILDSKGQPVFNSKDIQLISFVPGITRSYIEESLKYATGRPHKVRDIMRNYALGRGPHELQLEDSNGGNPMGLVLFQYGGGTATWNSPTNDFYKTLAKSYNLQFMTVGSDPDVKNALKLAKGHYFFSIVGHGDSDGIDLGIEGSRLTKEDQYLLDSLQSLNQNARIFLHSCGTAEGNDKFAQYVNESTKKKVYAAKGLMTSLGITIKKAFPFDIKIEAYNDRTGQMKDITYVSNTSKAN